MPPIDILLPSPMPGFVMDLIEGRYTIHKLFDTIDPQKTIEQIKNNVQFILSSPTSTLIDGTFMQQFPQLKGVVNFGVGYDRVDANWAAQHGIMVTHTPDVLNTEVADCALGLTLAVTRQLPQADRFVRAGQWKPKNDFPLATSLTGRTMGILGLGRIGKEIAKRAEAFGLKIIYHGRKKQEGIAYPYCATMIELAKACDILMLIAPGTEATKHIVNKDVLEALGPDGILINMARGSLVDQDALIDALEQKKILSAGLDVYAKEHDVPERLKAIPHIVLLPHIGSSTVTTRKAMAKLTVDNLDALASGNPPLTPVPEMRIL